MSQIKAKAWNKPKFMEVNLSDVRWGSTLRCQIGLGAGSDAPHSLSLIPASRIWTDASTKMLDRKVDFRGTLIVLLVKLYRRWGFSKECPKALEDKTSLCEREKNIHCEMMLGAKAWMKWGNLCLSHP